MFEISSRLRFLKSLLKRPCARFLVTIWVASGAWDLVLSEWIPEEYSKHLPRVYQLIAMTMGLISWQVWIITGFMIFVFMIFEYNFRRNEVEPATNSLVNPTANRAAGFPTTQPYQQETKLPNKDKLVSTAFRNVFKCQSPDIELTQKEKDKVLVYFQQEEKVIEELYGIAVKLNDDGSVEIYPLDSHSFKFGPMKKMVLERHRVDDKYIIVILRYEFEEDSKKPNFLYRILGLFPVPDDPKVRNATREMVEKMLGVNNKACQLI
jgi:hypothetical protein